MENERKFYRGDSGGRPANETGVTGRGTSGTVGDAAMTIKQPPLGLDSATAHASTAIPGRGGPWRAMAGRR